jgi:tetratricopeptide (TPR) repeat protein
VTCLFPIARPGWARAVLFVANSSSSPRGACASVAQLLSGGVFLSLWLQPAMGWADTNRPTLTVESAGLSALTPSYCPALPSPEALVPQALLDQLQALAPFCLNHAPFHRLRGLALLQLGRPGDAIEAIERALLIEPEHPGTQMDYAQALVSLGDNRSALQLIKGLLTRTDVPEPLLPQLQAQYLRLHEAPPEAPPPTGQWAHRWVLSQSLGADSNLNNATRAEQLTLTLPQGNVDLPIDQAYRPRAGVTGISALQWTALRTDGAALWLWQTDLRHRHATDSTLRYSQMESAATWLQAPDAPSQWVGKLSTSQLNWAGQYLYGTLRGGLQRQWTAGAPEGNEQANGAASCRQSLGAEWELRRFPASPVLNGHYKGVVLALHCPAQNSQTTEASTASLSLKHWSTQLRLGQDSGNTADRAGGNQAQWEWRNTWTARWSQANLQAEYVWAGQSDRQGYSALLSNNAPRRIQRHTLRGEVAGPARWIGLPGQTTPQWFVTLELSTQDSNLPAFASRQASLLSGLRWTLD